MVRYMGGPTRYIVDDAVLCPVENRMGTVLKQYIANSMGNAFPSLDLDYFKRGPPDEDLTYHMHLLESLLGGHLADEDGLYSEIEVPVDVLDPKLYYTFGDTVFSCVPDIPTLGPKYNGKALDTSADLLMEGIPKFPLVVCSRAQLRSTGCITLQEALVSSGSNMATQLLNKHSGSDEIVRCTLSTTPLVYWTRRMLLEERVKSLSRHLTSDLEKHFQLLSACARTILIALPETHPAVESAIRTYFCLHPTPIHEVVPGTDQFKALLATVGTEDPAKLMTYILREWMKGVEAVVGGVLSWYTATRNFRSDNDDDGSK